MPQRPRLESCEERLLLCGALPAGHSHDDGHDHAQHGNGCSCAACLTPVQQADLLQDLNDRWGPGHTIDGLLVTNPQGEQFYYDPAPELSDVAAPLTGPAAPGDLPAAVVPAYSSNPSSSNKIYLDFDGQNISGTSWNGQFSTIHAPAFSYDNDANFNQTELNAIFETWQRMAEDFAPFDVDVTTVEPASLTNGNHRRNALRVMMSTNIDSGPGGSGNAWFGSAGGVAFLNSWHNFTTATPVWVFTNNLGSAKNFAEAGSHEVGHAFGLNHDGRNNEYYGGHGSGETGWAPLMGVGYSRNLSQWSKGEYSDATNTEDDLARITRNATTVNYRSDDHSDARSGATVANPNNETSVTLEGIIATRDDQDMFRFTTGAGNISLAANNFNPGPNLDIQLRLFDVNGNLLQTVNASNDADATLNRSVAAGTYFVEVDGVGKGNVDSGYSDYGSLGQYTLAFSLQTVETDTFDFGDAPASYGTLLADDGARHLQNGNSFRLGGSVDAETDGLPSASLNGDDNNGSDDEDGVTNLGVTRGQTSSVTVETSGGSGLLNAWADWNQDGDFNDAGEHIVNDVTLSAGTHAVQVAVPAGAQLGDTPARFRFSTASTGITGAAPNGEVEDHLLNVADPADTTPPALVAAAVKGSSWTASFLNSLGGTLPGYNVPLSGTIQQVPWVNVDQFIARFSEPVDIQPGDLFAYGVAIDANYGIASFSYDTDSYTAIWTLDTPTQFDSVVGFGPERLTFTLSSGIQDDANNNLDGDRNAQLNVLPGNVDRGVTTAGVFGNDLILVRNDQFSFASDDDFNPYHDVDGSGSIFGNDLIRVRNRQFTFLPDAGGTAPIRGFTSTFANPGRLIGSTSGSGSDLGLGTARVLPR